MKPRRVAAAIFLAVGVGVNGAQAGPFGEIEALLSRNDFGKAISLAHEVSDGEAKELTKWIEDNFDNLIPPFGYELANRRYKDDPTAALRWFYISDLRARYDAMRCKDATSRQLIDVMKRELAGDLLKSLSSHLKDIPAAAKDALNWDKDRKPTYASWWVCTHGMDYVTAAMNKRPLTEKDMLIPDSDWDKAREDVRASFNRFVEKVKEMPK